MLVDALYILIIYLLLRLGVGCVWGLEIAKHLLSVGPSNDYLICLFSYMFGLYYPFVLVAHRKAEMHDSDRDRFSYITMHITIRYPMYMTRSHSRCITRFYLLYITRCCPMHCMYFIRLQPHLTKRVVQTNRNRA